MKSLAPILFGLASCRWGLRVLELQPIARSPGAVHRAEPLRDDALKAHLAGVPEHALAIVGEVLVQTQPRKAPQLSSVMISTGIRPPTLELPRMQSRQSARSWHHFESKGASADPPWPERNRRIWPS